MEDNDINLGRRHLMAGVAFAGVFGAVLASVPAVGEDAGVVTGPAPDLSALPRVKVDLVTSGGLPEKIRERVLAEATRI